MKNGRRHGGGTHEDYNTKMLNGHCDINGLSLGAGKGSGNGTVSGKSWGCGSAAGACAPNGLDDRPEWTLHHGEVCTWK
jgi:hypothetical protein